MPIDTSTPFTDGWWLQRLYDQLREQRRECQKLWDRYEGNAPLPVVNNNQREAVKWFYGQSRTNFERLIVAAVLSRLKIRGIRTAVDNDEDGDAKAVAAWKQSRGKLWSLDVHKYALAMRRGYVIVGKEPETGRLLVTAEDPRQVTAITDPADPLRTLAALKVYYDDAAMQDVAILFLPGKKRVGKRDRWISAPILGNTFDASAFYWSDDALDDEGFLVSKGESEEPDWLQARDGLPAQAPVVVFENEDGMAEFEPFLPLLDRINQQVLQRMTIATVQAFKQRAMKGLPKTDPKTGEEINYDEIFIADPGAIWNIPASVEIWESGEVNLQPILSAIRDDVKDLAAVSGTPLYSITPDAANGSAEGASLQRETMTFKVEARQDRWELSHGAVIELIFRTLGDVERAEPGTAEVMWAPADRPSMSERANAMAQTKGIMPRYQALTEIWGLSPDQAKKALEQLEEDKKADAEQAGAVAGETTKAQTENRPPPPPPAPGPASNGQAAAKPAPTRPAAPREQRAVN